MLVNRDPDRVPKATEAMIRWAKETNQQLVHVICDEPGAVVGDQVGINFFAIVPFLPRSGDRITLENGRVCEVKLTLFSVARLPDPASGSEVIALIPNVVAHLMGG